MTRLLITALAAFLAVSALAYARSARENASPPHVPTWKMVPAK